MVHGKTPIRHIRMGLFGPAEDASDRGRLRAIVVSASTERFRRAARLLGTLGFHAEHSPAVFFNATAECQGFNGHRLAMRQAWSRIAEGRQPAAVFEDDVMVPAHGVSNRSALRGELREYIIKNENRYDVLWLGGMGRVGQCRHAACFPAKILGSPGWTSFYTDHAKCE